MKNFQKFLEEITVKGNPGIPGEDPRERGENQYLSDAERRAKQRMNIRPQDVSIRTPMGVIPSPKERQLGRQLMDHLQSSLGYTRNHEDELSELANRVFRNLYQELMDRYDIDLDVRIIRPGRVKQWMDDNAQPGNPPPPPEFRRVTEEDIKNEVYKRKLANLIIQGEAKNTKHILHSDEVKAGLEEIYGNQWRTVFDIWDEMTKAADQLDWIIPIETKKDMMERMPDGMAGACTVDWQPKEEDDEEYKKEEEDDEEYTKDEDEDEGTYEPAENEDTPIIRARGVDFPMLIHEMVKGLFELLSIPGIPEDERTANIALGNTGMADEPEDFRYGPEIAADLRDFVNLNPRINTHGNLREELYAFMIDKETMPTADFLKLMKGILGKTPEARVKVDELIEFLIGRITRDKEAMDKYERDMEEYKRYKEEQNATRPTKQVNPTEEEGPEDNYWYSGGVETKEEPKETPKEPEEDYSNMPKKELQDLIDQALDDKDYDKVRKLTQYMGEGKAIYLKELERINESHKFHTRRK